MSIGICTKYLRMWADYMNSLYYKWAISYAMKSKILSQDCISIDQMCRHLLATKLTKCIGSHIKYGHIILLCFCSKVPYSKKTLAVKNFGKKAAVKDWWKVLANWKWFTKFTKLFYCMMVINS